MLVPVRMLKKAGPHKAGDVVRFDPASAASVIARGVAEAVEVEEFDPSEHGVAAVNDYLRGASPSERHRVLAAERAGKARRTVLRP
jgi:hypothetical protein